MDVNLVLLLTILSSTYDQSYISPDSVKITRFYDTDNTQVQSYTHYNPTYIEQSHSKPKHYYCAELTKSFYNPEIHDITHYNSLHEITHDNNSLHEITYYNKCIPYLTWGFSKTGDKIYTNYYKNSLLYMQLNSSSNIITATTTYKYIDLYTISRTITTTNNILCTNTSINNYLIKESCINNNGTISHHNIHNKHNINNSIYGTIYINDILIKEFPINQYPNDITKIQNITNNYINHTLDDNTFCHINHHDACNNKVIKIYLNGYVIKQINFNTTDTITTVFHNHNMKTIYTPYELFTQIEHHNNNILQNTEFKPNDLTNYKLFTDGIYRKN
ncbi:MAG: hypothetical protein Gaeavirus1_8 [Gaeavirus sp.]|uniref:Uncharacterized protein n=1 Tax=Gaeavirus sp. TaxID=2487767 RepID=A0A3G5A107_9VIRU|nr:MAG: hypothetical protein Gaeavirus1_8 [Gaeavirus sp.]